MRKLANIVWINFSRTLEINKVLQKSQEYLFKKNRLIFIKSVSFVRFLICSTWIFLSTAPNDDIEDQQTTILEKINGLASVGGGRMLLELLWSDIPRELLLFELFGGFQEDPTCKNIIIQLTSYPIKQVLRKKVLILGYLFKICRGK